MTLARRQSQSQDAHDNANAVVQGTVSAMFCGLLVWARVASHSQAHRCWSLVNRSHTRANLNWVKSDNEPLSGLRIGAEEAATHRTFLLNKTSSTLPKRAAVTFSSSMNALTQGSLRCSCSNVALGENSVRQHHGLCHQDSLRRLKFVLQEQLASHRVAFVLPIAFLSWQDEFHSPSLFQLRPPTARSEGC